MLPFENPETLLLEGAKRGKLDLVKEALSNGAKTEVLDEDGESPLSLSIINIHFKIFDFLLSKGAKTEFLNKNGTSVLNLASSFSRNDFIIPLLKNGANIHSVDSKGTNPLMNSASNGNYEITKILIEKGAKVNSKNKEGQTPLFLLVEAFMDRAYARYIYKMRKKYQDFRSSEDCFKPKEPDKPAYLKTLKLLLENGANPNFLEKNNQTILAASCSYDVPEFASLLINYGAEVNPKNTYYSPLEWACIRCCFKLVKLLLSKKAEVNFYFKNGNTPLLEMVKRTYEIENPDPYESKVVPWVREIAKGYEKIIKLLIQNGADPTLKDKSGTDAISIISSSSNKALILLLEKFSKKFRSA